MIEVQQSVVVVRTARGGRGEHEQVEDQIPIEWVQWGIDRLFDEGEVPAQTDAFGLLTEAIFTLLLTLPGAELTLAPPGIVLSDRRAWNLAPGDAVRRRDVHGRFGGDSRARISPSAATRNVFMFLEPGREGSVLRDAGVMHVPGERVRGSTLSSTTRAVLGHREAGRALRVFWGSDDDLLYAGEFELDAGEPFYYTEAHVSAGAPDRRIVFRLRPAGKIVHPPAWVSEGGLEARTITLENLDERHRAVAPSDQSAHGSARPLPGRAFVAGSLAASSRCARRLSARVRQLLVRVAPLGPPVRPLFAKGLRLLGSRGAWPPVLLCSCAAIALTTWGWTSFALRPAVTTWFLLVCPGMALVRLLPSRGALVRLVLAIATSLALETLVATATLEAKAWSPSATLGLMIILVVAASAVDLWVPASRSVPDARPRPALRGSKGG